MNNHKRFSTQAARIAFPSVTLAVFFLCAGSMTGSTITVSNDVFSFTATTSGVPPISATYCQSSAPCVGSATVIAPSAGVWNGTFLTYSASGVADYGVLKAYASGSLSVPPNGTRVLATLGPSDVNVESIAAYRDQWTVSGGQTGDPGTLTLTFALTGNFAFNPPRGVDFTSASALLSAHNFTNGQVANAGTGKAGTLQVSIPITLGQPFDYAVDLYALVDLGGLTTGGYDGESATVDLSDTARLTGISVLDQGSPVPFTLTTASGSPNFDVNTPEPGTWLSVALGLGVFGLVRRSRK